MSEIKKRRNKKLTKSEQTRIQIITAQVIVGIVILIQIIMWLIK